MGPPISIDMRNQIYHLFITKNLTAEELCSSLPIKVTKSYMQRLCNNLKNPYFASAYIEGARHSPGRPSISEEEIEFFLQLQAENSAFTIRKLYSR